LLDLTAYQEIFDKVVPYLPKDWKWFTLYSFISERGVTYMLNFGTSEDQSDIQDNGAAFDITPEIYALREEIAQSSVPNFTHIELTFLSDGKFDSVLGYGEPNLDLLPRPWPDDITSKEYTYTKNWPDGVPERRAAILTDPRSVVGVEVIPEG